MLEVFPSLKPFSTIAEAAISILPSFLVITHPIFNQAHGQREKDSISQLPSLIDVATWLSSGNDSKWKWCVSQNRENISSLLLSADCHVDMIAGTQAAILNHEVGVNSVLRMADERLKVLVPDTVDSHPSLWGIMQTLVHVGKWYISALFNRLLFGVSVTCSWT